MEKQLCIDGANIKINDAPVYVWEDGEVKREINFVLNPSSWLYVPDDYYVKPEGNVKAKEAKPEENVEAEEVKTEEDVETKEVKTEENVEAREIRPEKVITVNWIEVRLSDLYDYDQKELLNKINRCKTDVYIYKQDYFRNIEELIESVSWLDWKTLELTKCKRVWIRAVKLWALPSIEELQTIFTFKCIAEVLNIGDFGLQSGYYWSSTENSTNYARQLSLNFGYASGYNKGYGYYVVCVYD
jgi:hypothetical protein